MVKFNTLITSVKSKEKKNYKYLTHSSLNLGEKTQEKKLLFNHPWDYKNNYYKDIKKIKKTYNYILKIISSILNNYFNIKKDVRYWRIILGPWLRCFVLSYYEKNMLINILLRYKKNLIIPIKECKNKDIVPRDFNIFHTKVVHTSDWQDYLFSSIILTKKLKKNFKLLKKKHFLKKKNYFHISESISISSFLKLLLSKLLNFIFYYKIKSQKIAFFNTLLSSRIFLLLLFKNLSLPFYIKSILIDKPYNQKLRNLLINKYTIKDNFYRDILKQAILNLPKDFLENFLEIKRKVFQQIIPKKPNVIFTTLGIYSSSEKQIYIAECVSNGTKLILAQHGGRYGNVKCMSFLDHEIQIADKYISWGKKKYNKKILNLGFIKKINKLNFKENFNINKNILFVMMSKGRFNTNYDSEIDVKGLFNYYNNFCPEFYKNLKKKFKSFVTIRANKNYFWHEKNYLAKKCKFARLDFNRSKIAFFAAAKKSRISVCSYFSTTFIELMVANLPVILLNSFSKESYNSETLKIFKILKKNQIFFDNPKKTANFINHNWNNITQWWYSKKVQRCRLLFLNNFAIINKNLFQDIQDLIKKSNNNFIN